MVPRLVMAEFIAKAKMALLEIPERQSENVVPFGRH
jgi:hypothetical protein